MIRTQISLSSDQMRLARIEADRRGISLAALIRDALDLLLDDGGPERTRARARDAVGGFRSGTSNTAVDHDEVLAAGDRW